MMFRTWALVISLGLLVLSPTGGNPTFFAILDRASSRISVPVTDQEQAELTFFSCLEETAAVIPDLAKVERVFPKDDSYIGQRIGDIMFPRVRFDDANPEYRLYVNADPGQAELINSATCGPYFVGVEKVG
jgi:hypothetical protein